MSELDTLRSEFSSQQRGSLALAWFHYVQNRRWISTRALHAQHGGKAAVRPLLEELGGSIVYEHEENGRPHYALTFLGVLVSSWGEQVEASIVQYLKLAQALALKEPDRTAVSSEEVCTLLALSPEAVAMLGAALSLSPFQAGGSFGKETWTADLPRDIEDISPDPSQRVIDVALAAYDPNVPLPTYERTTYHLAAKAHHRDLAFSFVADETLKHNASQDWASAKSCFDSRAWKPCVIACGSALEAILLAALLPDPEAAKSALRAAHPSRRLQNDLRRWSLVDLVDAAAGLGLIGEAASHLGHALRLHRDLVHPGRQLIRHVDVTEGEAAIAVNTVEKCIRELSSSRHPRSA